MFTGILVAKSKVAQGFLNWGFALWPLLEICQHYDWRPAKRIASLGHIHIHCFQSNCQAPFQLCYSKCVAFACTGVFLNFILGGPLNPQCGFFSSFFCKPNPPPPICKNACLEYVHPICRFRYLHIKGHMWELDIYILPCHIACHMILPLAYSSQVAYCLN